MGRYSIWNEQPDTQSWYHASQVGKMEFANAVGENDEESFQNMIASSSAEHLSDEASDWFYAIRNGNEFNNQGEHTLTSRRFF